MGTIGEKMQVIRIERRIDTPDNHGGKVTTYGLRAVVSASIEPLSDRESLMASQLVGVLNSALKIWYRADLAITDRILIGPRVLQIVSFQDPTGKREELRILTTEAQAA